MNTHQQKHTIAKLGLYVQKTELGPSKRWLVCHESGFTHFRTRQDIIDHFTPKKGRPKTGKIPMVSFRCPDDVAEIISEYMKEKRVKRSGAIRELIRMGIVEYRKGKRIQRIKKSELERR